MHGQAIKILYFSFFASLAILVSFAFMDEAHAQGVDIGGWAWNNSLGWMSQRDAISDPDSKERKGTFGVVKYNKDQNGNEKLGEDYIEGWSWSSLYGFMCWGNTCENLCTREQKGTPACALSVTEKSNLSGSSDPPGTATIPTATITRKTIDVQDVPIKGVPQKKKLNVVTGWSKVLTMKDQGWVSLNGCTSALVLGICPKGKEYGVYFDPDTQEFRGWAWNNSFGWLAFSGKTLYDTPYTFVENTQKKDQRYEVRGTEVITPVGDCPVPLVGGKCLLEAVLKLPNFKLVNGNACLTPGLCQTVGFSEKLGKSTWRTQYVGPWIQTKGGTQEQTNIGTTIFSRKGFDLGQSSGFVAEQKFSGEYDQEYEEGGIIKKRVGVRGPVPIAVRCDVLTDVEGKEICSKAGKKRSVSEAAIDPREGALLLEFPKKSSKDPQKLVNGLSTLQKKVFTTLPVSGKRNVYGYEVVDFSRLLNDAQNQITAPLGGKIYLFKGSDDKKELLIGSPTNRGVLTIPNSASGVSAAGTIVSYGADIRIYRPIAYDGTANLKNLKQLASIAWIALQSDKVCKDEQGQNRPCGGRIIIDDCIPPQSTVQTYSVPLAGLFFAEGEIQTGHGDGKKCLEAFGKDPYKTLPLVELNLLKKAFKGTFSELDAPITVEGIMVAAKFLLQRVYGGSNQGSELILDTGRAHTNPPPGIEDIIRSLPFK